MVQILNNHSIEFVPNQFIGTAIIKYEIRTGNGVLMAFGTIAINSIAPTTKPKDQKETVKKVLIVVFILVALLLIVRRATKDE